MPSDLEAPEEAVERRALQLAIIHARAAQGRVPNTKYSPTDDAAHVGEMSIIDLRQEVRTSTSPQPRHAQSVGICAPPPHDEPSCNARDLCATTVYYPAHDVGSAASGDAHDQSWRTLATHGRAPAGDGGDPAGVGRRCATTVAAAGGSRLRADV